LIILSWGCFGLEHFWHIFVTHAIHFFKFKHFTFILQHLLLMVKNTFSHIFICMLDEIIKKNDSNLALKQKKPLFTPKNEKFKPKRKTIPL
jgi:hypothetical protein